MYAHSSMCYKYYMYACLVKITSSDDIEPSTVLSNQSPCGLILSGH